MSVCVCWSGILFRETKLCVDFNSCIIFNINNEEDLLGGTQCVCMCLFACVFIQFVCVLVCIA